MTNQPPPPPPGNPPAPPPPPPGQYGSGGSYPAPRQGFDPKTVNPLDWAVLGIGAIIFIFSFFDYYSWDIPSVSIGGTTVGGGSVSYSAWHTGGGTWLAWFAMALAVVAAGFLAVDLFVKNVKLAISARVLSLVLFGLSFLLYIIAIFAHDDFGPNGGHGFSFWLSLILAGAGAVLTLMRIQQSGGQLPGALSKLPDIGHYGPQGGAGGHGGGHAGGMGGSQPPAGYGGPPNP